MGYLIQKMAEVKIVMGSKDGKSYQTSAENNVFTNKKIGDKVSDVEGFSGYEFEITGGSDKDGFPMRRDLEGPGRRKILLGGGAGIRINVKGMKERKSIRKNKKIKDNKEKGKEWEGNDQNNKKVESKTKSTCSLHTAMCGITFLNRSKPRIKLHPLFVGNFFGIRTIFLMIFSGSRASKKFFFRQY